ncbi:DUF4199 domain-containing protein [Bacteroidia bacterium]|jgi:hypothetical protein|nr:DUF4199 domain-containing protein [Bacteroidia bacterium]
MQKSIWIFGTIAGILCAVLEYLFFGGEGGNANVMFLAKIAILLICIVAGLILIRKLMGGVISIARTIMSGVLISLVRALVMVMAFGFLYYPNGSFYKAKTQEAWEQAEKKVAVDEKIRPADKPMELEVIKEQIAALYRPHGYTMITIGGSLISGLIIAILMAAFIGTNTMYNEPTKQ